MIASFSRLQAYWINRTTIAIQSAYWQPGWSYSLVYSQEASLQISEAGSLTAGTAVKLTPVPAGFSPSETSLFPHLAGYTVLHLPSTLAVENLAVILHSQVVLTGTDSAGFLQYLTGVQTAGVLDDLFFYNGLLGPVFSNDCVTITLWAPTAQSVQLLLFANAADTRPFVTISMTSSNGVWKAQGDSSWKGKYYLYEVAVYVPSANVILHNLVTDPYSADLALNGTKTRLTDLGDPSTKPAGWETSLSPPLESRNDFSAYELHVRDFSSADPSVPDPLRGTYLAFTLPDTHGVSHLQQLAQAGIKAIHLLPTFHFGSVNEDKSTWQYPVGLTPDPPDGEQQQAAVEAVKGSDAYNWGYDPVHYFAPEGSYAFNPDDRVREYRQMVSALHNIGLRVVQDMVFNHTVSCGQAANSVLDKIVPNYYYRLNADGNVYTASCCPDTASEHRMMEKLIIDNLVQNARQYKIDGFRFDLMGFHFVDHMRRMQAALAQLTLEENGVDGSRIYLYGEGWEVGETAHNALGLNASQGNMYGMGIGTFNDRMRDAVRGGGPFDDPRIQGFATGLFTDPSLFTAQNQSLSDQANEVTTQADWIRVALAGNLRDFTFTDRFGRQTRGGDVIYNGQPAGYVASPIETVNYCSVHDNQTLFDAIQLKSAIPGTTPTGGDSIAMRMRRQILAMSLVALGQGMPLFLAGDDLLRSKDMDHNSYESGDWFNKIDWTRHSANWGIGLPMASENKAGWPLMRPLLANSALTPTPADISACADAFQIFLRIRNSSRLFRMATLAEIQTNLQFLNTGSEQTPGLIVMKLAANGKDYGTYNHVLVVFNATIETINFEDEQLKNLALYPHPLQQASSDPEMQSSTFNSNTGTTTVSALTTAVFVM